MTFAAGFATGVVVSAAVMLLALFCVDDPCDDYDLLTPDELRELNDTWIE